MAIGRNTGTQLSDNITEERMLQARLMELSKERYKFINQITYEKKMFLDRQQRKSAALKEKLMNVSLDAPRYKSKSAHASSSFRNASSKKPGRRRGSIKRSKSMHDKVEEHELARPQTVPPRLEELAHIDIPPQTPPIFQTEPLLPESKYSGPGHEGLPRLTTPVQVKFSEHADSKPHNSAHRHTRTNERNKKSTPIAAPSRDPRFKHLEHSLCENYELPSGAKLEQVSDIVGRIEALSVKAKVQRDVKPKLALKAYQFLTQRRVLVNTW